MDQGLISVDVSALLARLVKRTPRESICLDKPAAKLNRGTACNKSSHQQQSRQQEPSCSRSLGLQCGICFEDAHLDNMVQLQYCCHTFCRDCFQQYLQTEVGDSKVAIFCPTCRANGATAGLLDERIGVQVSDALIRRLLPREHRGKYDRLCLALAAAAPDSTIYLCRQDGCGFAGVREHGDSPMFTCPQCGDSYCVRCNSDWHHGMGCEQYQREKASQEADSSFQEWFRANSRPCPKCGHAVQKSSPYECNKLTCANRQCRALICHICGQSIDGYDHFNRPDSPCYGKLWEGTLRQPR